MSFDEQLSKCLIPRSQGYEFYFRNYVFRSILLDNKVLFDVGGGNGIASFFFAKNAHNGSSVVIDPLSDGSNDTMRTQFRLLKERFVSEKVSFLKATTEALPHTEFCDIMLMHNSINHFDESIVFSLAYDNAAQITYRKLLGDALTHLKPGGFLIVSDCSSNNFFGNFFGWNPFAPAIEWNKHASPRVWEEILSSLGLTHLDTSWNARRELGSFGKLFLANKYVSYFLDSHFTSIYKKEIRPD